MPALLYAHHRPGYYLRVLEEGEVGAGDAVERIAVGPEAMTVSEVSALLYLPGHTVAGLRRALAIPALSEGWRQSFVALLDQHARGAEGNQGLAGPSTPPAWPGLRPFRVADEHRESDTVRSFVLEPVDGDALPDFRPGQFLALKLKPPDAPAALLRSYSLAAPSAPASYRIAVKRETAGVGQRLSPRRGARRRRHRRGCPARRLHPRRRRRRSGGAAQRRRRRHPGARHARRAGAGPGARARCGGCTARAAGPSIRSRPRHASCSPPSPRRSRACATAARTRRPCRPRLRPGRPRRRRRGARRRACRPRPTSTSVDRQRSSAT